MSYSLYQIDSFASNIFRGNPAGVVPLTDWLDDTTLQNIAAENNVAATAFFKPGSGKDRYALRWFTPLAEIPLCAHGSIAAAWVICEDMKQSRGGFIFETQAGELAVQRKAAGEFTMNFPIDPYEETALDDTIASALGAAPIRLLRARYSVAVFAEESDILELNPDFAAIGLCQHATRPGAVVVTAPADSGQDYDFVSRFFAPGVGVNEDPVTGSAHCILSRFWADELEKDELTGYQLSARRGTIKCHVDGERVNFTGQAVPFAKGKIIGSLKT